MTADTGTVVLSVASRDETVARMEAAMHGETQGAYITFPTVELLWKVLTSKRLAILRAMTGGETISIREVARRVGRDVKAVHADVRALVNVSGTLSVDGPHLHLLASDPDGRVVGGHVLPGCVESSTGMKL